MNRGKNVSLIAEWKKIAKSEKEKRSLSLSHSLKERKKQILIDKRKVKKEENYEESEGKARNTPKNKEEIITHQLKRKESKLVNNTEKQKVYILIDST